MFHFIYYYLVIVYISLTSCLYGESGFEPVVHPDPAEESAGVAVHVLLRCGI